MTVSADEIACFFCQAKQFMEAPGHKHSHSVAHTDAYNKAFLIGIGLNTLFVLTEVAAGIYFESIALLTDAGHNASDVASLLLSLFAFRLAKRKATEVDTYGLKKTTVLAALANALILLLAIGILGYESVITPAPS